MASRLYRATAILLAFLFTSIYASAAEFLVNFGGDAYTTDGANTWQSFDIRNGGSDDNGLANISGAALSDSTGAASGITFSLGASGSPQLFLNNPADADITESFAWFDDSVAEQRQNYALGPTGNGLTYTFSGFNPSDSISFEFLVARVGSGGTGSRIIDVSSSYGGLLYDDADTNLGGLMVTETVTGATYYTYTLIAQPGSGYPGSINALRITLPDLQPGVTAAFSSPINGGTLYANDPVTVEVNASAVDTSVDRVELTINGAFFASDETAPYTFSLGYLAEGALNLSATVYGADSSEDTDTATATVASPFARAWTRHSIDTGINGADGARPADVDGDGDLDLIVAFEEDATVRIYENPGVGTAINGNWSYVSFNSGLLASIEDANLADLDGDGRLDFIASMEGTNRNLTVYWAPAAPGDYWNNANWTAMTIPAAAGQDWMYSQVLDLDGQNGPDIVAGSKGNVAGSDPATVSWFAAPADPRVAAGWIRHTMTAAGWIMSVEPYDMDGDTDLDIVISDRRSGGVQQGARWLENPGAGSPNLTSAWTSHTIAGTGSEVMFLDIVDLDDDGLDDVIIPLLQGGATDQWLFARRLDASGDNWSVTTIDYPDSTEVPGGTGDGKAIISVDVDGDGVLDVVSSHGMAFSPIQGLVWGQHDGDPITGNWTYSSISGPEGEKFDRIVSMDVDGDGDLDLITTDEDESLNENGLGVVLYENPGKDAETALSPGGAWRRDNFGFSADAGVAANAFDFDFDGLPNLIERATGSDPTLAASVQRPEVSTPELSGSDYLALTYRRIAGGVGSTGNGYTAGGITYTVEHDEDLTPPWSSGAVTQVGDAIEHGDKTETVTARLNVPISDSDRGFIRLKFTSAE